VEKVEKLSYPKEKEEIWLKRKRKKAKRKTRKIKRRRSRLKC